MVLETFIVDTIHFRMSESLLSENLKTCPKGFSSKFYSTKLFALNVHCSPE